MDKIVFGFVLLFIAICSYVVLSPVDRESIKIRCHMHLAETSNLPAEDIKELCK